VNRIRLSDGGLSNHATNCVDFSSLSSLDVLDLSRNKFSSLPSRIGFLPKLEFLSVTGCGNLVSILDLPSSLYDLDAYICKSLQRIRIPIRPKEQLYINLGHCNSLEEIQDIKVQSNIFWNINVDDRKHSPNKLQKIVFEVLFLSVSLAQEETHTIDICIH
jgi:leucine-rich repeat protein SHOC2